MGAIPNRDEALARPAPRPRRFLADSRPRVTTVRAFVALDVDEALRRAASDVNDALRRGPLRLARARWVQTAQMHVTVRFLGDVDEARIADVAAITQRTAARSPAVVLRAHRMGAFPDPQHARVLMIPFEDDAHVAARIAASLDEALAPLGLACETRPYVPHLTLARFRDGVDVQTLCETTTLSAEGVAEALTLHASELTQDGPRYTALVRAPLG